MTACRPERGPSLNTMADAKVEGEEEERRQSWPRRLLAQKADLLRKARRRRRTLHLDELPLGYKIVKQALLFLTWATIVSSGYW